jgi:hypothetical protein
MGTGVELIVKVIYTRDMYLYKRSEVQLKHGNTILLLWMLHLLATGTSARCRPDAMNEKFRKVDTHLHGMYYEAI